MKVVCFPNSNAAGRLADVELHFEAQTRVLCPNCNGDGQLQVAERGPLAGAMGNCAQCDARGYLVADNPLGGLKLLGFSIWENKAGIKSVTFPGRTYEVHGERRFFALLRPVDAPGATQALTTLILDEYAAQMAVEKA